MMSERFPVLRAPWAAWRPQFQDSIAFRVLVTSWQLKAFMKIQNGKGEKPFSRCIGSGTWHMQMAEMGFACSLGASSSKSLL